MKHATMTDLIIFLLILLFCYAAISKLMVYSAYTIEMQRQLVPAWSVHYLTIIIPVSELLTVALLLFNQTKTAGLVMSVCLMGIFTIYVGLAMTGAFGKVPCSCGGIISRLNWPEHFAFNMIFLALSIYGLVIDYKKRRFVGK